MKKLIGLCFVIGLYTVTAFAQQHQTGDKGKTFYDAEKTKPKEVYMTKEITSIVEGKMSITTVKQGPYFYYYENGKLKISGEYTDDKKSGTWKYYDQNGKLTKTEKYVNDELVN